MISLASRTNLLSRSSASFFRHLTCDPPERPVQDRLRLGLLSSTIARYGAREGFSSYLTTGHWQFSPFIGHDDPQNEVQQPTGSGK